MIKPLDHKHLNLIHGGAVVPMPRVRAGTFWPATEPAQDAGAEGRKLSEEIHNIVADAYHAGRDHGQVQHYRAGWRFGLVCGLFWGAMCGVAVFTFLLWALP